MDKFRNPDSGAKKRATYRDGSAFANETSQLVPKELDAEATPPSTQVYPQRWWILFMFTFVCFMQAITLNLFVPLGESLSLGLHWDPEGPLVFWLVNTSNITTIIFSLGTAKVVSMYGIRTVTLLCAIFTFLCASLRLIPADGETFCIINFFAMFSNGLAACWTNFGSPLISSVWFPVNERNLATAIGASGFYLGSAFAFVVGMRSDVAVNGQPRTEDAALESVNALFFHEACVCLMILVAIFCYFPAAPKLPPSTSAAVKHTEVENAREEGRDHEKVEDPQFQDKINKSSGSRSSVVRKYWVICILSAIPVGVSQSYVSVLGVSLQHKLSDSVISSIGFWMVFSGCIGSILIAVLVDRVVGRLKTVYVALIGSSGVMYFMFVLVAHGWLHLTPENTIRYSYLFGILGGFCFNCSVPLSFEIIMEEVFGVVNQSFASGAFATAINSVELVCLLVASLRSVPSAFVGYANVVAMICTAGAFTAVRMRYSRTFVDTKQDVASSFDAWGCM